MGSRGKVFTILKFRSMAIPDKHSSNLPEGLEFDRITRVGRVIRKYRIDELPQLWNVLKGDLSLIGPRPEAVGWVDRYRKEIPFYSYRNIIRPGITGWAQVMQGHVHGLEEQNEN